MLAPPYSTNASGSPSSPLHVAVIGGGITGVTLALGLEARGISYTLYERTAAFKEIGAGVGFSPNAEVALAALGRHLHAAYKRVAMANGEDYFQWVDGSATDEVIYRLYLGEQGFQGCRRSDFLDELVKMIPEEKVQLGKAAEAIEEVEDGGVRIRFRDGTQDMADIVIGCDGIHSSIRQLVLGKDSPATQPTYSHKFCFRALVPTKEALKTLSNDRTSTRFMYNGPNAHAITYPVTQDLLNVLLVISDPKPWKTEDGRHIARGGRKQEAVDAFADWHPAVKAVVDLMPEEMDKWAIFDMMEHPAPFYGKGRVCIAGDAAHAAGPHLGAGAGFGMEDALVLAELLQAVNEASDQRFRADMCRDMLKVYNDVRYARTQWLVKQSRVACDFFQWTDPYVGSSTERFSREITRIFHQIWEFDIEGSAKDAVSTFREGALSGVAKN
ncbi:hypothetical protein PFICI_07209 [Pestalotiopsis fici W106-1]|uniref:FAD-binding domain-containing protein n=1 Tax=Pestalotiopsis fici (strain W106-1 / CGMCC3.15140) TaxID=1229662 RepID=W3X9X9_PESFW|nr:uncharacterized protein PFICI_07209 [Pestalotiopsis fici W106-1]ETS82207.1 hypothetical protein PFICI_07209 [Pestalotiopsis fici W106-1]